MNCFSLGLLALAPAVLAQPLNDNFADAVTLFGPSGTTGGSTVGATREAGEPSHWTTLTDHSVWFRWIPPWDGFAAFDTFGSTFDTVLAVYTGTNVSALSLVARNDDSPVPPFGLQSYVLFQAYATNEYFIAVDGWNGASGNYRLNWDMPESPEILPPPPPNTFQLSATSYTVNENSPGFAKIRVDYGGGAAGVVTVHFRTVDDTAVAGRDYIVRSGTLIFEPGETNQIVTVQILDNALVDGNRTFHVVLSNPTGGAVLGNAINSVVTILDDESESVSNPAGEFEFSAGFYRATDNETVNSGWDPAIFNPRNVRGALITVNRLGGSTGRVMVDYLVTNLWTTIITTNGTVTNPTATPFTDYIPESGTLIFDDFQMSTNFVVQVFSDRFGSVTNTFFPNRTVELVLSNPRAAPGENPATIVPTLGFQDRATLSILQTIRRRALSIERATYRTDEVGVHTQDGVAGVFVEVILPGGGPAAIDIHTWSATAGGRYSWALQAGSDYADHLERNITPDLIMTDGAPPILNPQDYETSRTRLTFGDNDVRRRFFVPIIKDDVVEFNEDIYVAFVPGTFDGDAAQIGIGNSFAHITILYDDQPAGALDREWNRDRVAGTVPPFNTIPGANNMVNAVVVQPDQKTVIGGDFTAYNSVQRNYIARVNEDGSLDTSFFIGTGANGFVAALALYPEDTTDTANEDKILVGGGFNSFNGIQRNHIARLNSDGSLDASFNPGLGANGIVRSIAVQGDGGILIAGDFTQVGGEQRFRIARLLPNGGLDASFNPGLGADDIIWAVALDESMTQGPRILVGGDFTFFGNELRFGIARLNDNGSLDPSFHPGAGADNSVNAVAVQADGRVLIGGEFKWFDFRPRNSIARLNQDGSLDLSFDPGAGANGPVFSITVQPDGKALAGGMFTSFNHTRRMGLTRLMTNGVVDTSFLDTAYNQFAGLINTFSFEPRNFVNSIALQADGNVMIGGSFTNVGGNQAFALNNHLLPAPVWTRQEKRPRFNLARLLGGATPGPGSIEFASPSYSVDENAGTLAVTLQRVDGRLGTLMGEAVTSDRTAQAGLDYGFTQSPIIWPEWNFVAPRSVGGIGFRYLTIPIFDDTLVEGDETFDLSLSNPQGSLLLGGEPIPLGGALRNVSATVTITDNDFDHGTLTFESPEFTVNEGAGQATITVIRTNGSSGRVSVRYLTIDSGPNAGTAQVGADYISTSGELTFASGVTTQKFTIPIINDTEVEFDETVRLVLTNATGGAILPGGLPTSVQFATLTIIDDDFAAGRLNFRQTNYTTLEDAGQAAIEITRTGGNSGQLQVVAATGSGTALAGVDFVGVTNLLTWNHGDSSPKYLVIPLLNNHLVDGTRTVNLTLSNASLAGAIGNRGSATLQILDDDAYGGLAFSSPEYTADENGTNIVIHVIRTGGIAGHISVGYSTTNGTAIGGTDYIATSGVLDFAPGEISKSFSVTLIDNDRSDGHRSLELHLGNPGGGAWLASPSLARLTIIDDESASIPAGTLDTGFNAGAGPNQPVYALAVQNDGKILMGGNFTRVNNVTRNSIARLTPEGNLDNLFTAGTGLNAPLRALALQNDGRILVGGFFTQVNGTNLNHIARLHVDGSVDFSFNPGAGASLTVFAIAVQADHRILIGGAFSSVGGVARSGIARLNTNGTVHASFDPGSGVNGTVYAIALQSNGKIVIGGEFTTVNNIPRKNIARLELDGSLDLTFDPGAGFDEPVRALVVQPDGRIVAGGAFTQAGGISRGYIARLHPSGAVDPSFLEDLEGANGSVLSLALQTDGKLLAGGDFTRFNGVTRNRLTRLNHDGSTDPSINFAEGANGFVAAIAVQPDRKVVIGGAFTRFAGAPRNYVARLHGGSLAGSGGLEFTAATIDVNEAQEFATVSVRRRGGTTGTVTVQFSTADGTAVAGKDYVGVTNVLTFPQGETFQTVVIPILDDDEIEPSVSVLLTLSNPTGGASIDFPFAFQPTAVLNIVSDDSVIRFRNADYSVSENVQSGFATIEVVRSGATNTAVSVQYATVPGGTATADEDYLEVGGTLEFAPGQVLRSFNIPIIDDELIEPNETVFIELSNPSENAVLGQPSLAVLTIMDNDFNAGTVSFASSTFAASEGAGNAVITLLRTNGSTGLISVRLTTANGTAFSGIHYLSVTQTVSFAEGETVQTVLIPLIDNDQPDGDKNVVLTLSNPTGGALLQSPVTAVLIIQDDDFGPGSVDFSFDPGLGANDLVRSVALQPDGKVLAGGAFTRFGNLDRNYIVRMHPDGLVDLDFDPGLGADGVVHGVASIEGKVVLGGAFGGVGGVAYSRVARLLGDGGPDLNFTQAPNFNSTVNAIAVHLDGRIVVGGSFILPSRHIIQLRANGTVDTSFNMGAGADGAVHFVRAQSGGGVLFSGAFTTFDGEIRSRVARLRSDGFLDNSFLPTAITNGTIYTAARQSDGKIVIGGDFQINTSTNRTGIARLNADGSLDDSFNPGSGVNGIVFAIVLQANGKIILGGNFTTVGNVSRNRFARLHPDGGLDFMFNPGSGANGTVYSLALQPDNYILLGGEFTMVNGVQRNGVARVRGDAAAIRLMGVAVVDGEARLAITSTPGVTYVLEASTNLVNWISLRTNNAAGSTLEFTDPGMAGHSQRFYRVRQAGQ